MSSEPAPNRATFIALRAGRQAHGIASDIRYPELRVEPPPEPHVGWDNPEDEPLVRSVRCRPRVDKPMLAVALLVWSAVVAVFYLVHSGMLK